MLPKQPHYNQYIKVGGRIWNGLTIATIPDTSAYEIILKIGEEFRGKLEKDLLAKAIFPAIPDLTLKGKIVKIGLFCYG